MSTKIYLNLHGTCRLTGFRFLQPKNAEQLEHFIEIAFLWKGEYFDTLETLVNQNNVLSIEKQVI